MSESTITVALPAEPSALDTLERLLLRVARRYVFDMPADSPMWDLPLPQLRTLFIVGHRKSCTMGHLAEQLGVAMSTVTQIADRLEKRGLVDRVDDPEDRRVVRLALSETGREVVAERRRQRRQHLEAVLTQMPVEKQGALLEGLQALDGAAGWGSGRECGCAPARSILGWLHEDLESTTDFDEVRPGRGRES